MITALLSGMLILASSLSSSLLYLNFQLQQAQIAVERCQMKDIPDNSCQGQCVLEKQLKQTEQKQTQQMPHTEHDSLIYIFVAKPFQPGQYPLIKPTRKPRNEGLPGLFFIHKLLRPPQ